MKRSLVVLAISVAISASAQVSKEANAGYQTREGRSRVAVNLDNPEREKNDKPRELVGQLGIKKGDVIVSDAPWDVAWYGDRAAVWLPGSLSQFNQLKDFAKERKSPIKGLMLTQESINKPMVSGVIGLGAEYRDWYKPITYTALFYYANDEAGQFYGKQLLDTFELDYRFPSRAIRGGGIIFFTDEDPEKP